MGRTDAGRGAPDAPQGARVVELERALAHETTATRRPPSSAATPPGCVATFGVAVTCPPRTTLSALPRSSPTSTASAAEMTSWGWAPTRTLRRTAPSGSETSSRRSAASAGAEHRAAGAREREVARRTGQDDAAAHDAGGGVDQCERGRIAQRHSDQTARRVGHHAFGAMADHGDPPSGGARRGRRARRLRRRRQLVHGRGAATGQRDRQTEGRA